ncbi:uncharacterized protein LOC134253689 [Saccostrea cucullata]|uniref:uncharacterized protein LOC134253689 n=1 Tax=Saccostrea cuccullata TaxID=36930 RepID=UPI002ED11432
MMYNCIYLDKPIVQIGSPERDDKSDVIIYHATIESIPEALKAEWRVQQIPEDDFKPINVHDSSYRGSTVSLPYPVLTVHGYSQKHGQRFEIRVTNFIGETREVIYDQEAVTEGAVSTCNTLRKVLEILKREGLFSNCDVILVQYVLRRIGCLDLYERCYKYAQACEALCFFERQPENGYTTVGFHIDGNIKEYSKEDIYSIRDTVANMLECSEEYVVISGIELVKSFLVVLSIKEEYIFAVLSNAQDIFERLRSLNVDYLAWGDTVIRKGHTSKEQDVELAKWITEDKLYQETHCFHEMMERVRSQKFVTFVGGPGSGKSATAHHIALMLQSEKYAVKPVKDLRGIIQMEEFNYSYKQVFVIDDVIGVFGLQRTKLVFFDDVFSRLFKYEKCKILFTCRETVYRESLSYDPSFEWYENIINLHSSEYALDDNDKKLMMENYGLRCELLSPSLLTSASHMFPFLCKLFSKEEKFRNFGSKFFTNPNECIITELDEMQAKNKFFYATLVLCIMNEKLSENILEDLENAVFLEMKNSVLANLDVQPSTDTFKFLEALSNMEGTYTKKSGTEYTIMHDYLYEICAYHYGQKFPGQMLQYMSSSYIANKVKLQKNEASKVYKSEEKEVFDSDNGDDRNNKNGDKGTGSEECFDLCIWLSEDLYPMLAKRLYRDIQEMELDNLFTNDVLKHPKVCQTFIDVLKEKSYNEIKSLFLYERLFSRISEVKVRVLTWVILYGHYDILQYIVGEIEKYGKNKSDLFYRDVEHQHWNTLKKTLNKDILSDEERYMLLLSSYSGNLETVKIVLKFVNKDSIKKPIKRKYLETRLLNSKVENEYRWKCVPLVVAFEGGHLNIVHELIKAEAGINLTDKEGRTPLIIACDGGHLSIAQELIKFGADLNVRDIQGNTAMITAFKRGHFDLMQELIEAGADVNLPSEDGHIILIDACEGGHLNIVQNLIKAGADINIRDKEGKIAVVTASMKGNLSIVQDLVKAGADINLKNKEGNTPLITACEGGYLNMVQELIKMGAVVNVQNIMGKSPLIAACIGGYMCIVQELFKVRADVNHIGMVKNTPLVAACKYGHLNIVQELIKMGADVNLQDNEECTPIKAAREGEHLNIVKELVKMGVDDS